MSRTIQFGPKPSHLMSGHGGRQRQATEFDDQIVDWYAANEWVHIPYDGDEDKQNLINEVKRAAKRYDYGLSHVVDEDNSEVWFEVRDKRSAGPVKGSKRDPETNKMVAPGTDRYNELVGA